MNSLYGVFGRSNDLIETRNILKSELLTYSLSNIILNTIDISRYKYTILMLRNMDQELVEDLKLKFNTILTNDEVKINNNVAAAVTGYARIINDTFYLK
jgi:LEA14-like dessication related protein